MNKGQKDAIVVGGAAVLIGGGVYLAIRSSGAQLGDKITMLRVTYNYRGHENTLYICWGLRDGDGNFNNGGNLVGGLFACGGPMIIESSGDWVEYTFVPKDDFEEQPIFFIDPDIVEPRNYQPYIWLSTDKSPNEAYMIQGSLIRGNFINIKE